MAKKLSSKLLIEFNPKLPKLSKSESKVLQLLIEAGKLIVPIYNSKRIKNSLGPIFILVMQRKRKLVK